MNSVMDILNPNFSVHENACRTCLKLLHENCNKFFLFQQNLDYKIHSLTSINLHEGNGLPNFICNVCFEKLNNALEFKKQIETINDVLKRYINNLSVTENCLLREQIITAKDVQPNESQGQESFEEDGIGLDISNSSVNEIITRDFGVDSSETLKKQSTKRCKVSRKQRHVACPTCGKKIKGSSLKAHLRIHGIVEKKLECDSCGKKYTNQYDLRVHLRKHSGSRPFSCKVCQKTFADQRCFEKHKKIHSGEKLFKCEVCDKSFIHSYTLKTHLRVHSGEKPFICAKCGHSFTTTTQLKLHTRIHHTQEKPYSCNLCSKVFASSSGLSNHKMTHTGERKFICSVCGKGSRTTSDLKCHLRTHTGERPFQCSFPDCDKKYKTNSQLCTHIRTHTGEKEKYHKCSLSKHIF